MIASSANKAALLQLTAEYRQARHSISLQPSYWSSLPDNQLDRNEKAGITIGYEFEL